MRAACLVLLVTASIVVPPASAQGPGSSGSIRFVTADFDRQESVGVTSVTLERVGGSQGEVGILVSATPGTASPGSDYASLQTPISWPAGETGYREFVIQIIDDDLDEIDETIHISMSIFSGGATLGTPSQATVTILDDDFRPGQGPGQVGFVSAGTETSEAMPFANVGVARTDGSLGAVSIDYLLVSRSAQAGRDFTGGQGTLEWEDGESGTKVIPVPLHDDTEVEGDETFWIHLGHLAGGAAYGPLTRATVTLRDDEAVPPCENDETHICLLDRFLARVHWKTPNGQSGDGRVERLTDASAAFEFFEPGNTEIVVKLKDACGLPPGDVLRNFWVFVAGLTNVRVEVTLVDTESGIVRRFYNTMNQPFFTVAVDSPDGHVNPYGAIQATSEELGAFPTCDL